MQRILHTMLRVSDMERSIKFYTQIIGMRLLRTLNQPSENYTLAFLGFDEESASCVLELTYNYDVSEYNKGNAYGHIAIGVDDCSKACDKIKSKGGEITLEPRRLKNSSETIAFTVDPDGYQIELIERNQV